MIITLKLTPKVFLKQQQVLLINGIISELKKTFSLKSLLFHQKLSKKLSLSTQISITQDIIYSK